MKTVDVEYLNNRKVQLECARDATASKLYEIEGALKECSFMIEQLTKAVEPENKSEVNKVVEPCADKPVEVVTQ